MVSRLACSALVLCATLTLSCRRVQALSDAVATRGAEVPSPAVGAVGARVPAFPGAEGFGAGAQGGRGGAVCRVRTLAHDGPGSLQSCFDASGPRTVVFDVSGTIEGPLEIKHGRLTVAGQTSPRGVVVKGGVVCDNFYDPNDCNDVILRHLRLRGGTPDSLRLGGAHDVIVDHCSMEGAEDENLEISRSRNITVQRSVIAEPWGEHYRWGGVLLNYSTEQMPLENITIHHSVWNGVAGRLPEISCEENEESKAHGRSNCSGHLLSIELANNVLFDASDPIWFNRCTGNNEGNECAPSARTFALRLNLVGNVLIRRSTFDADTPFATMLFTDPKSAVFARDNRMLHGAAPVAVSSGNASARHAFPSVAYDSAATLVATLARTAGALPRDKMDERLAGYLGHPVDARPPSWQRDRGIDRGDAFAPPTAAPLPPVIDANGDGVPDGFQPRACAAGYTPLECYLNELSDSRTPR